METIEQLVVRLTKEAQNSIRIVRIESGTAVSDTEIMAWEKKYGYSLPFDYRYYLKTVGGCRFHGSDPTKAHSFKVRLFPLHEVEIFTLAAYGKEDKSISRSWFAIADAQDGNYIVMDLETVRNDSVDIIDGFSEGVLHGVAIISKSFTEFLKRSLSDSNTSSGAGDTVLGTRYWSTPGGYYGETGET